MTSGSVSTPHEQKAVAVETPHFFWRERRMTGALEQMFRRQDAEAQRRKAEEEFLASLPPLPTAYTSTSNDASGATYYVNFLQRRTA